MSCGDVDGLKVEGKLMRGGDGEPGTGEGAACGDYDQRGCGQHEQDGESDEEKACVSSLKQGETGASHCGLCSASSSFRDEGDKA